VRFATSARSLAVCASAVRALISRSAPSSAVTTDAVSERDMDCDDSRSRMMAPIAISRPMTQSASWTNPADPNALFMPAIVLSRIAFT
jgi:hypothetical protein